MFAGLKELLVIGGSMIGAPLVCLAVDAGVHAGDECKYMV